MVVYYIAQFTITDPEKYKEYGQATQATMAPLFSEGRAKVIVLSSGEERGVKEGSPENTVLVVEFESREVAENWYNSDAYQKLIPMRQAVTKNGWVIITDKFTPPS